MGVKYDRLDLMILNELREDCTQSVRKLAQKLGSHPNTIMQRIKHLENEKVILKYSARIDFRKIGYDLHNLVFIRVNKATRAKWDILKELKQIPDIVACYATSGAYDLFAIVRSKHRDGLSNLIKTLNSKDYIIETKTDMILDTYKHEYEFNPLSELVF